MGSEMCIRDSIHPIHDHTPGRSGRSVGRRRRLARRRARAGRSRCRARAGVRDAGAWAETGERAEREGRKRRVRLRAREGEGFARVASTRDRSID